MSARSLTMTGTGTLLTIALAISTTSRGVAFLSLTCTLVAPPRTAPAPFTPTVALGPAAPPGYAATRVDIRGTGNSGGILEDEYSEQELLDGLEIIAWIAAQPWCDGQGGVAGTTWGGFNGLPPAAGRAEKPGCGAADQGGDTPRSAVCGSAGRPR